VGGNLFAADFSDQTIYKFAPDGTRTIFIDPSAFQPDVGPLDIVFDAFGMPLSQKATILLAES
jgi:hypothetical protein